MHHSQEFSSRRDSIVRRVLLGLLTCTFALCVEQQATLASPAHGWAHHRASTRGEEIARALCSACHVVSSDQEFPPLLAKPAPSFRDIANRPGSSASGLEHFIATTHWDVESVPMTMPNPGLSEADTAAVVSFILSQREHRSGVP